MYYTYMIRCEDNSIYTGITTDIQRRLNEHTSKSVKCAKYTLHHYAVKYEAVWVSENRSMASKLEYRIKTLTKSQKEELIIGKSLADFFQDKINTELYSLVI